MESNSNYKIELKCKCMPFDLRENLIRFLLIVCQKKKKRRMTDSKATTSNNDEEDAPTPSTTKKRCIEIDQSRMSK